MGIGMAWPNCNGPVLGAAGVVVEVDVADAVVVVVVLPVPCDEDDFGLPPEEHAAKRTAVTTKVAGTDVLRVNFGCRIHSVCLGVGWVRWDLPGRI